MQAELAAMVDGVGSIVNVTSVAGLVGMPELGGYSGSKHGVVGLTWTTALEYAARGIRSTPWRPGRPGPTSRPSTGTTAGTGFWSCCRRGRPRGGASPGGS